MCDQWCLARLGKLPQLYPGSIGHSYPKKLQRLTVASALSRPASLACLFRQQKVYCVFDSRQLGPRAGDWPGRNVDPAPMFQDRGFKVCTSLVRQRPQEIISLEMTMSRNKDRQTTVAAITKTSLDGSFLTFYSRICKIGGILR